MVNEVNPKCPVDDSPSHKIGFIVTRKGKKQRFRCIKCGRSFYKGGGKGDN